MHKPIVCRRCGKELPDRDVKVDPSKHCTCEAKEQYFSNSRPADLDWYDRHSR